MATIVVVDDREETRLEAIARFAERGTTPSARMTRDAVRTLEHVNVDLLLLNVRQANGLQILQFIHETPRCALLPVVMMIHSTDNLPFAGSWNCWPRRTWRKPPTR